MSNWNRDEKDLITVGYHKGEMDFGISSVVGVLTYEQMKELREMIVVAIGQAERMWADKRQKEEMSR